MDPYEEHTDAKGYHHMRNPLEFLPKDATPPKNYHCTTEGAHHPEHPGLGGPGLARAYFVGYRDNRDRGHHAKMLRKAARKLECADFAVFEGDGRLFVLEHLTRPEDDFPIQTISLAEWERKLEVDYAGVGQDGVWRQLQLGRRRGGTGLVPITVIDQALRVIVKDGRPVGAGEASSRTQLAGCEDLGRGESPRRE